MCEEDIFKSLTCSGTRATTAESSSDSSGSGSQKSGQASPKNPDDFRKSGKREPTDANFRLKLGGFSGRSSRLEPSFAEAVLIVVAI